MPEKKLTKADRRRRTIRALVSLTGLFIAICGGLHFGRQAADEEVNNARQYWGQPMQAVIASSAQYVNVSCVEGYHFLYIGRDHKTWANDVLLPPGQDPKKALIVWENTEGDNFVKGQADDKNPCKTHNSTLYLAESDRAGHYWSELFDWSFAAAMVVLAIQWLMPRGSGPQGLPAPKGGENLPNSGKSQEPEVAEPEEVDSATA